jgi:hypothetical protein
MDKNKVFFTGIPAALVFVLLLCTGSPLLAEDGNAALKKLSVGLEGGWTYNILYTSAGYRAFTEYEPENGFSLGIPVQYDFFDWLAVRSGFSYIQKNYAYGRTSGFGGMKELRSVWTNGFIEFPVTARFSFGGSRLRGFLNLGGFLGFWAHSSIKGTSPGWSSNPFDADYVDYVSYDEQVEWDDRRDNRFDAGLLAGAGVQYRLGAFSFYVEGRFNYGLTDLQKDYMLNMVPRINDTLCVQAGVMVYPGVFKKKGAVK